MKDRYLYKVGYYSYEESAYEEFWHNKKFSKQEFENIIFEAVDKAIKQAKREDMFVHCLEDVITKVFVILQKDYGFEPVEYTQKWEAFGWASLFVDDWHDECDDNLKRLKVYLRKKGYTENYDDLRDLYCKLKKKKDEEDEEKRERMD